MTSTTRDPTGHPPAAEAGRPERLGGAARTQPASRDQLLWMLERMLLCRRFEEAIGQAMLGEPGVWPRSAPAQPLVPSWGQEPVAVAVCVHLRPSDVVTASRRSHQVAIAKGVSLPELAAEALGKRTALRGGPGGHLHLFDPRVNYSCSGWPGESCGPAVGAALSRKMQNNHGVAVAYVGDRAVHQAAFHEALNLASVWRLPVLFVIESLQTPDPPLPPHPGALADDDRGERPPGAAHGYGMPGHTVRGHDTLELFALAGEAIARAREGLGPTLIEVSIEHNASPLPGETGAGFPPPGWRRSGPPDPIALLGARLRERGLLGPAEEAVLVERVSAAVTEALAFARRSPRPAPPEAMDHVFFG